MDEGKWGQGFVNIINANIVKGIKDVIEGIQQLQEEFKEQPENFDAAEKKMIEQVPEELVEYLENHHDETLVDTEFSTRCLELWKTDVAKYVFKHRGVYQIQDSLGYFMDKGVLDRVALAPNGDYRPNRNDVLNARSRTTGIVEKVYLINNHVFRIVDVGGQRSERKKWINCFDAVTAVIFVASLSAFDQTLFEDDSINRMHESLRLFGEVLNLETFKNTDMILFLNKNDIFIKKIKEEGGKITTAFKDYPGKTGPDFVDEQYAYIKKKFKSQNTDKSRQIYVHKTTATDTKIISQIFNDVQTMIVQNSLKRAGLIAY
eukprot:TRINITY_DN5810_c0_g1_i2.p1 TRINITY_DN5810_c0_g1~~TRINITY_DN5810_c0_g1_i2.p1  ORF type:complete len:318 (-),score=79.96 TRINITY_DN5810_c0_g1_i2:84-1037(-)